MAKAGKFTYDYARPALTADVAVFTLRDRRLCLLLIRRAHEPFAGRWALPGGFVDSEEPLERAAIRELLEETGVAVDCVYPVAAFGDPGRDPRGWTVSAAYYCLAREELLSPRASDDAAAVDWHSIDQLPPLAFDHAMIMRETVARMRRDLYSLPVARDLLPPRFAAAALHEVYALLDPKVDLAACEQRALLGGVIVKSSDSAYYEFAPM